MNTASEQSGVAATMHRVHRVFESSSLVRALNDVTFEVPRGEVFGLLGLTGSGKSTALRILAGQLSPSEGKARVFGRSPRRRAARILIGYVPGNGPLEHRKSLDFLSHALAILRGRRPAMSTGTALLWSRDLILLDEPFAKAAPGAVRELKDLIRSAANRGKTVILSSDSLIDATEVCDRLAVLRDGRIEATGTLEQLLARARNIGLLASLVPDAIAQRLSQIIREELCAPILPHVSTGAAPALQQTLPPAAYRTKEVLARFLTGPPPTPLPDFKQTDAKAVDHEKLAALTRPSLE